MHKGDRKTLYKERKRKEKTRKDKHTQRESICTQIVNHTLEITLVNYRCRNVLP